MAVMKKCLFLTMLTLVSTSIFAQGEQPYVERTPTSEQASQIKKKTKVQDQRSFEKMIEDKNRSLIIKRIKSFKVD